MAKKVGSNHYLAAPQNGSSYLGGYWTDGEGSQRTDRTADLSEYYTVHNERAQVIPKPMERRHRKADKLHKSSPNLRSPSALSGSRQPRSSSAASVHTRRSRSNGPENRHYDETGSDVYVTSAAYRAPSQLSRGSRQSRHTRGTPSHYAAPSEMSVRSKLSRKGGVTVETMSAPNPFCPNTRGCCCLLLLVNLGIILVTLGFVIVMQFYEPVFVWVLGIIFLIFGFIALNVALVYCVSVCKDAKTPKQVAAQDHYWTRHWQKTFGFPEIHYSTEKSAVSDRYSDVHSVGKSRQRY